MAFEERLIMSKVDWEKILKQSGGKVRDDSSGFLSFILGPCHSHNITLINITRYTRCLKNRQSSIIVKETVF